MSSVSSQWPPGNFDLVVLNEVACRFDDKDVDSLVDCVMRSTSVGAHVLGVHARSPTDCPLRADDRHHRIAESPGLVTLVHHIEDEFVLDIWERW